MTEFLDKYIGIIATIIILFFCYKYFSDAEVKREQKLMDTCMETMAKEMDNKNLRKLYCEDLLNTS